MRRLMLRLIGAGRTLPSLTLTLLRRSGLPPMLLARLLERRRDQPAVPGKPEGRRIDCASAPAAWPRRPRGTAGRPAGADSRN